MRFVVRCYYKAMQHLLYVLLSKTADIKCSHNRDCALIVIIIIIVQCSALITTTALLLCHMND